MKRNSKLLVNSTHKTKTWWIFVSVLVFVFITFLIVLLLCGEVNLLDLNWIIAKNKSVWHGYVTNENIDALVNKYWIFYDGGKDALRAALEGARASGNAISINSYKMFFNAWVLLPLFGLLVWSFVYPIIFNATKVSGLDVLPFSFTLGMIMFTIIITGLIPVWGHITLCWIVRIVIASVIGLVTFFVTNHFVNKFLATRSYSYDLVLGYKSQEKETAGPKAELKTHLDEFKNEKGKDITYVDVPEGK